MYSMKLFGITFRLDIVIIALLIGAITGCFLLGSCCRFSFNESIEIFKNAFSVLEEGFVARRPIKGHPMTNTDGICSVHGSYCADTLSTAQDLSETNETSGAHTSNLFFFADNEFKPECCGSEFSNSQGCACITTEQKNFINQRGGNRSVANSV